MQLTPSTKNILIVFIVAIFVVGCSKKIPAGFWTNYQENYVIKKSSDQGPWGGFYEIHWKSDIPNTFKSKDVMDFALKNGWTFTDSTSFNYLERIKSNLRKSYDDYSDEIMNTVPFTWRINTIMRFSTGWIAVKPGNSMDTDRNGFVGINSDGTKLFVYHLWGE
jgi:hypothetical protein